MLSKSALTSVAAFAALAILAETAQANLALQLNPNASVSSLSLQLLKKPRSQAGNYKNVWDCDPPEPALSGMHYFLYNIDANYNPLSAGERVISLESFQLGPGYTGSVEVLARNGEAIEFVPSNANGGFDYQGRQELGLARINFELINADLAGQISEPDDGIELDYDAIDDDDNPNTPLVRGFEHIRLTTASFSTEIEPFVQGLATTVVPDAFLQYSPSGQPFTTGFLTFNLNGQETTFSGNSVYQAFAMAPEPASLAVMAGMSTLAISRRRKLAR